MTSVICEAHRELFCHDRKAAQHAFEQLDNLLMLVRTRHLEAPILAIHHARLEIVHILLLQSQTCSLAMMRTILQDLSLQQPAIPLPALNYFLDMARTILSDCCFPSATMNNEANHLLASLALLAELPDELLCRALCHVGKTHDVFLN